MARKKLGETTSVFWSEDDLNLWAENSQLDIVWKAKCKRDRTTVSASDDTVRYALSRGMTEEELEDLIYIEEPYLELNY